MATTDFDLRFYINSSISNPMNFLQGVKKTLILQEIPEERAQNILSHIELMAACDVAIFVYDRYGAHIPPIFSLYSLTV